MRVEAATRLQRQLSDNSSSADRVYSSPLSYSENPTRQNVNGRHGSECTYVLDIGAACRAANLMAVYYGECDELIDGPKGCRCDLAMFSARLCRNSLPWNPTMSQRILLLAFMVGAFSTAVCTQVRASIRSSTMSCSTNLSWSLLSTRRYHSSMGLLSREWIQSDP